MKLKTFRVSDGAVDLVQPTTGLEGGLGRHGGRHRWRGRGGWGWGGGYYGYPYGGDYVERTYIVTPPAETCAIEVQNKKGELYGTYKDTDRDTVVAAQEAVSIRGGLYRRCGDRLQRLDPRVILQYGSLRR